MLFLQYPPCSTCQKAKKWLDDHGIAYTARHIKEDNPTADELRAWVAKSGLPLKRFFNTSGLVYKNLGLKDKLPTMTEDEQIALLAWLMILSCPASSWPSGKKHYYNKEITNGRNFKRTQ